MFWLIVSLFFICFFAVFLRKFPESTLSVSFELLFEKIYHFYEDITGKESSNILSYIITLFFVLLSVNLLGVIWDFISPIFWMNTEWEFIFSQFFQTPSSDISFNIAVALVSILLLLYVQFGALWYKKALYNYFPFFGKGYFTLEQGSMRTINFYILTPLVKIFDIILSMFLAFLDIIGLLAKVVSLSFRLFGNIVSGWVLLALLIGALSGMTEKLTEFMGGIHFPIIFPLILYAQSTLVACIQAMVFSLLVAIFIRVSQLEAS